MHESKLPQLKIDPALKRRPRFQVVMIFAFVGLSVLVSLCFAVLRNGSERRVIGNKVVAERPASEQVTASVSSPSPAPAKEHPKDSLTVSGYIINRERIEISPRYQGVVSWIGVRKGDRVQKDQIVVRLDDAEQRAQLATAEARVTSAKVALERARIAQRRISELFGRQVATEEAADEARLAVLAAEAALHESEAQLSLIKTYLNWTVIRSPIDGVVLEKLVEPGELVVPMSYGGGRGPSTALIAVADPRDLQVELDVNEADLAKISLGRTCRIIPEAYPDKEYEGRVAEIAPEASRQKGTLQIKVQIANPDKFLTPELTAKVVFGL